MQERLQAALVELGLESENRFPRLIGQGKFNAIFEVREGSERMALRINNINDDPAVMDRVDEYEAHCWAASCGAAPQVFQATDRFLLMELLELKHPTVEDLKDEALLQQIVVATKRLHAGPKLRQRKSLWTRAQYWYERRRDEGRITPELKAAYEQIERLNVQSVLESVPMVSGHGDLNLGNIALLDDRAVLLDFETAASMSPFFDLSRFCYVADSEAVNERTLALYFGEVLPEHKLQLQASLAMQGFVAAVFGNTEKASYAVDPIGLARFQKYAESLA
ncbi:MAG: phosphotransferase [Bdellovibrionales bacterium]|nr:phosphotransferase [Bdellovibrionales bacterium]